MSNLYDLLIKPLDNWVLSRSFVLMASFGDLSLTAPRRMKRSQQDFGTRQMENTSRPPKIKLAHYQSFMKQLILGIEYRYTLYTHDNIYKHPFKEMRRGRGGITFCSMTSLPFVRLVYKATHASSPAEATTKANKNCI